MTRRTSELGYYVRGQASRLVGNEGLDTGIVRDGLVNNLNHLQDQQTQHWGSLCMPTSPGFGVANWTQATTTPDVMGRLDGMPPLPGILHMQADGSSSRLQVSLSAWVDAGTASFRVVLVPFRAGNLYTTVYPAGASPRVADISVTATTPTMYYATLYVSHVFDADATPFNVGDGGGGLAPVPTLLAMVEVWATSDNAAHHPHVDGLTVREYVG